MPAFLLPFFKSVLLQIAQFLLRWFLGIASDFWAGLLAEIARLDADQTLTNAERQQHAEAWLLDRIATQQRLAFNVASYVEAVPALARIDISAWLRRAVQFAVLFVRLRTSLSLFKSGDHDGTPPPSLTSVLSRA